MGEFENNITALLQQAFDALVVTEDSEIFDFEDEEEEAESAPIQYACRKIMEVIDLINEGQKVVNLSILEEVIGMVEARSRIRKSGMVDGVILLRDLKAKVNTVKKGR